MLLFVSLALLAVARADMPDGTIACDPALRPVDITTAPTRISSPNFPGEYPVDSLCEYRITAPAGTVAQLVFDNFNIEECGDCACDGLFMYNNADGSGEPYRKLCGNRATPFVQNAGSEVFLRFQSDSTASGTTGFEGTVTFEDNPACATAEFVDTLTGNIQSENYPNLYNNNQDCRWIIRHPNSSYVNQITFTDFALEDSCTGSGTIYDYLEFIGYSGGNSNIYGRWEGTFADISGATFSSYPGDDYTEIHFVSDVSIPARGFSIDFNLVIPS